MQISSALLTASAASAISLQPNHRMASMAFGKLKSRQSNICKPIHPSYSCEKSCGEGLEACKRFPNRLLPQRIFLHRNRLLSQREAPLECSASESLTASTATSPTPTSPPDDSGDAPTRHLYGNPTFGVANKIGAQPGLIAAGLGLLSFL
ncbi:hypothetical protein GX50_08321 [[Emmonsia] crescens]|uniref:Uncharacterized protein n=1 Tax=[Emmonsia] crescens TaxID=73230 RepID=A0A2B7Z5R8_9EURO|nr:hypothetical protein GX50_08321 [Emmonsia crescens]